jgi:hypothetical protein
MIFPDDFPAAEDFPRQGKENPPRLEILPL